ncbi:MAG: YidC/Oxa1 family membrane protein insertase [Armatimonadota bacterium]
MFIILGLVLFALVFSGCSQTASTIAPEKLTALGQDLVAIEKMDQTALTAYQTTLKQDIENINKESGKVDAPRVNKLARDYYLLGYSSERLKTYLDARGYYERSISPAPSNLPFGLGTIVSEYNFQAIYRVGVLGVNGVLGNPEESQKQGKQFFERLQRSVTGNTTLKIWVREQAPSPPLGEPSKLELAGEGGVATIALDPTKASGPVLTQIAYTDPVTKKTITVYDWVNGRLDYIYRSGHGWDTTKYNAVGWVVEFFKKLSPAAGPALALIFLALLVKIITIPTSTAAYRGMRDMQRVQPLLKELQEKYKDDKAKLAEAQMELMKAHKVSPMGGCLPMLIQLPIFLIVWQAVSVYAFQFSQAHFLWIGSLALPDFPLLILYTISMFITQKLTTTPSTDPQQKMMQNQMTFMMPVLMLIILKSFASAFVLYWLFLNIFSSAHQYYLMKKLGSEGLAPATAGTPSAGEKTAAPAPRRVSRKQKGRRP